jgi:hypothetical protein
MGDIRNMCRNCGCKGSDKPVQYECQCEEDDCSCGIIEFNEEPNTPPYCCGVPMKRIK